MAHRFLQANINHCSAAQDLLMQSMAQWLIEVAVVAEPYFVPARDNWVGDLDGLVAIVTSGSSGSMPVTVVARGNGYVAVRWDNIVLVGVYFSPNRRRSEFESFLDGVGALIRQQLPRQALVVGDLNAWSSARWSPATRARGETLDEWVTRTGLQVLNQGSVHTCVRQHGGSIVDVTIGSPAVARMVREWRVVTDVHTGSDHRYIRFDLGREPLGDRHPQGRRNTPSTPRWVLRTMDREAMVDASLVKGWLPRPELAEVEREAEWFRTAMSQVCDASMSRAGPRPPKRQVYWWSQEIANLRGLCMAARRQYTRQRRRRRRDEAAEVLLYGAYRAKARDLRVAISEAKSRAYAEMLETLSHDPWGRPYKEVRRKIRPWAPPLTESLEPELLERVVSALFPEQATFQPPAMASPRAESRGEVDVVPPVSEGELWAAILRLRAKSKAPGPDGIPGRAWAVALEVALGDRFRGLLSRCLETSRFPSLWKTGRLVLLRKDGRPADSPSAYRPIVLLDEAGKLFERVIAGRLVRHLDRVGPNLSEQQFGFRVGRSTIDAISRVRAISDEAVAQRGVVLAVSLDIANAFNTLPWACIREALEYHEVPAYLCRIVAEYLSGRFVSYTGREGRQLRKEMSCGVPQGSVLGPLLWNIGYDWVLRGVLNPGAGVICYADDTLVTARGETFEQAARLATATVEEVVGRIERLGLQVALSKSEALVFHGPRRAPPVGSAISIREVSIELRPSMKYLGLILDSRWNFRDHIARLAPRLTRAAGALRRLLPNLGGPNAGTRRLYLGVVRSMALYGAPLWAEALTVKSVAQLRKPQRAMAIGVIRGYRTISFEAACLMAGCPPWDLEAVFFAGLYAWRTELRSRGVIPATREVALWRFHARQSLLEEWRERLNHPSAGKWTVEAVRPVLGDWLDRAHGSVTFRLSQVISGHGCFGKYLHKVAGREPTPMCHHCGCGEDTAQHTLEACPAWVSERGALAAVVGSDVSLQALIHSMLGSEASWDAAVDFCEQVMSQKESAEREREATTTLPMRMRRGGGRRRAFQALLHPP